MNEEVIERMHMAALRFAAIRWLPDPALSPEDIVSAAWLRVLPRLTDDRTEAEQTHYLLMAVTSCAVDAQRVMQRRPRGEYGDWLPSPQRVEDEAIASAELAPIIDRAAAGDRATVAQVALGMGYRWADVMAGMGVSRRVVLGWHLARQELAT